MTLPVGGCSIELPASSVLLASCTGVLSIVSSVVCSLLDMLPVLDLSEEVDRSRFLNRDPATINFLALPLDRLRSIETLRFLPSSLDALPARSVALVAESITLNALSVKKKK